MSYYATHEAINAGLSTSFDNREILYKFLNLVFPNFYVMVAVISFFYISTIFFLIKNNLNKNQYWLATAILLINPYFFLVHLSSFTQTIAICFFVIAVHFGIKRKPIMYFLFIAVAIGFHQSAIILIPIYFLLNKNKINGIKMTIILGTIFILMLTPLFNILLEWGLTYFPNNYTYYYEQELQNTLKATLISSIFFFLVLFNINKLEGREIVYGKLSLIGTIILLFGIKVSLITRLGKYFEIFLILTFPHILSKIKVKAFRHILFILIITIYLLRYFSFFNDPIWTDAYSTYRTILGK